jgi:phosphoribosylaminoimidazole synthetase
VHDSPTSSYADAGVDLDLAQRAKAGLSSAVASTATPLTLDAFGSFGGVIRLPPDIPDPAIVASIDGVGTKLHLAIEMGRPADAGRDLVNHCVNDVAVQNARPIAFLDYVAADRLDPAVLTSLVQGMASACREAGVSIVGGETALMPDTYATGRYDAVGAVIGVASAAKLPVKTTVSVDDICIGLPSSGPHTNGYSLARELLTVCDRETPIGDQTLEDALLAPHLSYLPEFTAAFAVPGTRVAAHITGGGIAENLERVLPDSVTALIDATTWSQPPIFEAIADRLDVSPAEMFRVFNMGVGAILVASPEAADRLLEDLPNALRIGTIAAHRQSPVELTPTQ